MTQKKNLEQAILSVLLKESEGSEDDLNKLSEDEYTDMKMKCEGFEADAEKSEITEEEYTDMKAKCEAFEAGKLDEADAVEDDKEEIVEDELEDEIVESDEELEDKDIVEEDEFSDEEDEFEFSESDEELEDEIVESDDMANDDEELKKDIVEEEDKPEDEMKVEADETLKVPTVEEALEDEEALKLAEDEINKDAETGDAKPASVDELKEAFRKILGKTASNDLLNKVETVFKAALSEKMNLRKKALSKVAQVVIKEQVKKINTRLVNNLSKYTNYAADEYLKENKLAVESGIKNKLFENLITKMKSVFVESYIEVPASKVNYVRKLENSRKVLAEKLNVATKKLISIENSRKSAIKNSILESVSTGLFKTDAERLKKLSESIEFKDGKQFRAELNVIKENYFKAASTKTKTKSALNEQVVDSKTGTVGIIDKESEKTATQDNNMISLAESITSRFVKKDLL